jgi:2-polyprenyl-3-methyl-5-hydroxy-6-metoxy-1,4-benzoquinol methylase
MILCMKRENSEDLVAKHYDASAENYHLQYERNLISDVSQDYPANYFRLHQLINSFTQKNVKKVIEVGVGEGTPLITLSKAGMDVSGFDISHKMVEKAKANFSKNGLPPEDVIFGDIQDPITYSPLLKAGQFDALLAMGVLPHVRNEEFVLKNMKNLVKPSGRVFVEFRNKLFSLFTFNRYTYEFIMDDLLAGVSPQLKSIVSKNLKDRLQMDLPTPRIKGESANLSDSSADGEVPGYDAILSKFHNPFEMIDLFEKIGFKESKIHWYHYHPAMPNLSEEDPQLFRDEALKLEHNNSNWKGMFLCSAFVIEAVNPSLS